MPVTKIVVGRLTASQSGKGAAHSVRRKRVVRFEGRWKTIMRGDANSATLDSDLLYVFKKNVAKARRENKRITGFVDRAPRKART